MKKILTLLFVLSISLFANERVLTDDSGLKVTLKGNISRVADSWYAHTSLLMALGKGSTIVVTSNAKKSYPWMYEVQPSLNSALLAPGAKFNIEELLKRKVQLAFILTLRNWDANALKQAKIPTLQVYFHTLKGLKQNLILSAKAFGDESSMAKAKAYNAYLDAQINRVQKKLVNTKQRPKVIHINSLNPLKVDGQDTLISSWIKIAGGVNAASFKGNSKLVTPEEVLNFNPDVIIIGANAKGKLENSPAYSVLKNTKAVKNKQVFINPKGVFLWDRYGVESALQIQWAAKVLHPKAFLKDDLVAITQDFYKQFFGYLLSKDGAKRILSAKGPKDL